MEKWIESNSCLYRYSCEGCRINENFRKKIEEHFIVPESWPECPYGITADNLPETKAVQTLPESRKDICKHAVRKCCGKPFKCSVDNGDCPDRFNLECKKIKSAGTNGNMMHENKDVTQDDLAPRQENHKTSPLKKSGGCRGCKGRKIRK